MTRGEGESKEEYLVMRKSHEIQVSGSTYKVFVGSLISAASTRDGLGRAEAVDGDGMASEACHICRLALRKVRRPPNKTEPSRSSHADGSHGPALSTAAHPAPRSLSHDRPTVEVCQIHTRCL